MKFLSDQLETANSEVTPLLG